MTDASFRSHNPWRLAVVLGGATALAVAYVLTRSTPIASEGSVVTETTIQRDLTTVLKAKGASGVGFDYLAAPPGPNGETARVYVYTTQWHREPISRLAAEAMVRSWLYLYERQPEPPVGAMHLSSEYSSVWIPMGIPPMCLYVTKEEFVNLLQQSIQANGKPNIDEMISQLHPTLNCRSPVEAAP